MFYTVCYNEGTCGSFIASLLILMLSEDSTTIVPVSLKGSCESLYGNYSHAKLDLSEFESFRDVFKIKPASTNTDNFTVWKGVESYVDCEEADRHQPNWHQLVITHEIDELFPIRLMHWFKGDVSYYQRFYNDNKDKMTMEVDDVRSLRYEDIVKFLTEYIPVMLANEFAKFDQNVPSVWNKYYESLSEKHKKNFTTIKFSDILGDPELVLDTLSKMTSKPVTENIRDSYRIYLDAQRNVFAQIFRDTGLAPKITAI
jgi:hypothetical protein